MAALFGNLATSIFCMDCIAAGGIAFLAVQFAPIPWLAPVQPYALQVAVVTAISGAVGRFVIKTFLPHPYM